MSRPPLLDLDLMAAREAAAGVLRWYCLDPDHLLDAAAANAVDAVWEILGPVAYAAGRASVLEAAMEQYAVLWNEDLRMTAVTPESALEVAAQARTQGHTDAYAARRRVTEWQPIEEANGG